MMTKDEALKMAIEQEPVAWGYKAIGGAMDGKIYDAWHDKSQITQEPDFELVALYEHPAPQQDQEPVYMLYTKFGYEGYEEWKEVNKREFDEEKRDDYKMQLYTHPAKQLSDDEIEEVLNNSPYCEVDAKPFARAIEKKIRGE